MMTIAEQIDKKLTSRQRAKLTKSNISKILVAILFYITIMVIFMVGEIL